MIGPDSKVDKGIVQPGLYPNTDFQPMFNSTRALLNECWRSDCLSVSTLTKYQFAACAPDESSGSGS
jgi:hypothetical protein